MVFTAFPRIRSREAFPRMPRIEGRLALEIRIAERFQQNRAFAALHRSSLHCHAQLDILKSNPRNRNFTESQKNDRLSTSDELQAEL
jgi:hypothetical protein